MGTSVLYKLQGRDIVETVLDQVLHCSCPIVQEMQEWG